MTSAPHPPPPGRGARVWLVVALAGLFAPACAGKLEAARQHREVGAHARSYDDYVAAA